MTRPQASQVLGEIDVGGVVMSGQEGGRMRLPHQFNIPNLPEDSPFNDLFRHFFEGIPEMPDQETRSLGSRTLRTA